MLYKYRVGLYMLCINFDRCYLGFYRLYIGVCSQTYPNIGQKDAQLEGLRKT